jgi:23S rRNA (pseudouridine1915-N3)-methyltransferase
VDCEIVATKEAKGLDEKHAGKILDIEAQGLEKRFKDDYIICLFDKGREMNSKEFSRLLESRWSGSQRPVAFVAGSFLGLAERILERADFSLSLSRMTFSHELSRVVLLEQVYRSLTMIKGGNYAK